MYLLGLRQRIEVFEAWNVEKTFAEREEFSKRTGITITGIKYDVPDTSFLFIII